MRREGVRDYVACFEDNEEAEGKHVERDNVFQTT